MRPTVAVLLYPGCIFFEIAPAAELLAPHATLRWLTPDGRPHQASHGAQLLADGDHHQLAALRPAAVLVPGGDPRVLVETGVAVQPLRAAHAAGAWMAGICAGALVLAHAGLLRGRRATHNYLPEWAPPEKVAAAAPIFDGVDVQRADLVVDAPFITAMPWAYRDFAAAVAQALGVIDAAEAARYIAYPTARRISSALSLPARGLG
jgi:transcriptional regulator GlxA family with amidase domain